MSQPSYKKGGGEPVFGPAGRGMVTQLVLDRNRLSECFFFSLITVVTLILEGASKLFFSVAKQRMASPVWSDFALLDAYIRRNHIADCNRNAQGP